MLRQSTLMDKVGQLKASITNSVEVSQLAEAAFNNLKVRVIIPRDVHALSEVNIYRCMVIF